MVRYSEIFAFAIIRRRKLRTRVLSCTSWRSAYCCTSQARQCICSFLTGFFFLLQRERDGGLLDSPHEMLKLPPKFTAPRNSILYSSNELLTTTATASARAVRRKLCTLKRKSVSQCVWFRALGVARAVFLLKFLVYCKSRIFRTHSIFVPWALRPFVRMKFSYSR